jgi:polynucleotide 5'-hydroxyl-kinase GRC3/NOL9
MAAPRTAGPSQARLIARGDAQAWRDMPALHVPEAWQRSAATILEERLRLVLLLGSSDAGKSSYARFLVRELAAAGQRVAVVDADIGQKTIGPPAAVTLAHNPGAGEAWPAAPDEFYFVGSPDPVGRMLPLVVGTSRLVRATDAPFVIVDTTGFVEGAGRVLKGYKIEAIRPDLIVAIEKRGELEPILRPHAGYRAIRIRPSRKARPRDRWERDLARERAFAAYFRDARRAEIELDRLAFQRALLFTGEPVALAGAIYAERTAEGLVAVAERPLVGGEFAKWLKAGFERGLLCGVTDEHDRGIGLAVLEGIDFGRRSVALMSPVPAEGIRVLQLGDLYVGLDGRELGRVAREGL